MSKNNVFLKNVSINLLGQLAPLVAAVFSIPILIGGIGVDRFGVLSLVWMLIGYFSLLDFGLGRALTKLISERVDTVRSGEIQGIISTGFTLLVLLGVVSGVLTILASNWLVAKLLDGSDVPQDEALNCFITLALSLPFVILAAGQKGVLEGYGRFDLVNLVRAPLGILTFIAPLCVLQFSSRLDLMVASLASVRIVTTVAMGAFCVKIAPRSSFMWSLSGEKIRPLFAFGAWMTVSNVIGPMMVYMDRFIIAAMLGIASVAYYVTPYEVVVKLLIVPGAVVGVLFPLFSSGFARAGGEIVGPFLVGIRWIFFAIFPVALMFVLFADEILRFWISDDFARNSGNVLKWLAIGVFLNAISHVPFIYVQAAGRADVTAKIHLVELPLYLLLLWFLLGQYGIVGAAIAWTLRAGLDLLLLIAAATAIDSSVTSKMKSDGAIIALSLAVSGLGMPLNGNLSKAIFCVASLAVFAWLGWRFQLSEHSKAAARSFVMNLFRQVRN